VHEVFPAAKVCQECKGYGKVSVETSDGKEVVTVSQRDLYRKYQWPAKDEIVKALQQLKASR